MGRPKLTDDEKAARKAVRDALKQTKPQKVKSEPPSPAEKGIADTLIQALDFVCLIDSKNCRLERGYILANNGVVTLGSPISIDPLTNCPETRRFRDALVAAGSGWSLTELPSGHIAIRAGRFLVNVPCLGAEFASIIYPDYLSRYPIDGEAFISAMKLVAPIATESDQRLVVASLLCRDRSILATNGMIIAEAWHGQAFPSIMLPKSSAQILFKIKKKIIEFSLGTDRFDPNKITSITFYFEDGSFFKSQLYDEQFPDVDRLFNEAPFHDMQPLPPEWFPAFNRINNFVTNEPRVYIACDQLSTADTDAEGAVVSFERPILNIDTEIWYIVNPANIAYVEGQVTHIGFSDNHVTFTGPIYRAIVMQIKPI